MKTIQEFLQEKLKPVKFEEILEVGKISLNEADDPLADAGADTAGGADPLAGDANDTDAGGDIGGDPLAGFGGGEAPSGDEPDAGIKNAETEEDSDDNKTDEHEDDPDWTQGVEDPENVMLDTKPAGESIYDGNSVLKSINAVRASRPAEELKSIDQVQKALELIVNGKKLKIDDVSFEDPDDAIELISAIEEPLDIKLRNYIDLKIKQPIIAFRDKNKAEIAKMAADNDKARDTIDAMNKQSN